MPWGKRKSGDKWEVVNEETGDVKGTHDSESDADNQLAALYANANPEEEKAMNKALFIPITKINIPRHEVWGYSTSEIVDNSDEIMDYASTKPLMLAWSQSAQKRSGGKSLGNVRAMHQNIAAGKLISLQADDVHKGFYVGAKITDDREWAKVEDGTYTGFSIGGSYFRRWPDFANPGKIRYTAKPSELSIVDAPCNPQATFQMVKMDGSTAQMKFKPGQGKNLIKVIQSPRMIKVVRGGLQKGFDPSEPRDESGRWTGGGGGGEKGDKFISHPQHEEKPANLSHPLHNTPDTVIGRDFKPHPVGEQQKESREGWRRKEGESDDDYKARLNQSYESGKKDFETKQKAEEQRDAEQRAAGGKKYADYKVREAKENAEFEQRFKRDYPKYAAKKVDSQGEPMDNTDEITDVEMPEELRKEPEAGTPENPAAALDETQPIPADENEDELPAEPESLEDRALKIVSKAIIDLGDVMDEIESHKLSKQNIPGAPESIANIPLESKVGPSFSAEQMPAPNVLLELKPNAEPAQEVLATHAVTSKDLTDAFDAWLPKVGAMVKALIDERLSKDDTQSAPAQTIVVDTKKKLIKVQRKES